jgi:hypothetical protein
MRAAMAVFLCLVTLCIVGLAVPTVAQSPSITPTPEAVPSASYTPEGSSSQAEPDSETAALRAQLELMRQYDERLLQTVYWALGTAFGLVVFVAGVGWYVNFRLYERDKEALRSELRLELDTRVESISASLKEEVKEAQTSLDDAMKQTGRNLDEQAKRHGKEIEKTALQAGEATAQELGGQLKELQAEIIEVRYEMSMRDAEKWAQQGVRINELRKYMDACSLAVQLTEEHYSAYEWLLGKPLEGIEAVLRAGTRLRVQEVTEITEMLDALPPKYSIQKQTLRALMSVGSE